MRNVALFGQMASGKSAIAAALADSGYVQMSFATPLKNIAELAYGKIDKSAEYEVTALDGMSSHISGREVLQRVGQAIKSHDRDFWLHCFFRAADNLLDQPIVVDDGRFVFEYEALRKRGWFVVGIQTSPDVRMQRYLSIYGRYPTETEMNHESEKEIHTIVTFSDIVVDGAEDPYYNVGRIRKVMRSENNI